MHHTFFAAAIAVASVVGFGCANKDDMAAGGSKPMGADACAMCEGHQKATASNTCPKCNMSVDKMKSGGMKKSSADACETCPGVQTTAAESACPACAGKPM